MAAVGYSEPRKFHQLERRDALNLDCFKSDSWAGEFQPVFDCLKSDSRTERFTAGLSCLKRDSEAERIQWLRLF